MIRNPTNRDVIEEALADVDRHIENARRALAEEKGLDATGMALIHAGTRLRSAFATLQRIQREAFDDMFGAPPHPLDDEEISVTVFHVPTGLESTAQDDPGTAVNETYARALDDLLSKVEQRGGS